MDQLEASLRAPSRALVGGDSVALFRAPEGLALARCLPKCSAQRGLGPKDSLNMRLMGPSAQCGLGQVQALPEAKAQGLSLEGELLERHRALRSCESFAKICAARLSEVASHHGEAQLQMRDRDLWPMAKPHTLGGPVARSALRVARIYIARLQRLAQPCMFAS